jgi:hypothetical protein
VRHIQVYYDKAIWLLAAKLQLFFHLSQALISVKGFVSSFWNALDF